jgi:hypothetical protein
MTYESLFDFINLSKKLQIFEGNLDTVFTDILGILEKEQKTRQDYGVLAFHNPRIIRALVDIKEGKPDDLRLLELLKVGISTSLNIFRNYNDPSIKSEVLELREEIVKVEEDLLEKPIRQVFDFINLFASEPRFSQATAMKLNELIGSEDAILFAAGHGGIGIGLDVVLRYEDISGRSNLAFYPIRFSRTDYKGYNDTEPRLTPVERDYLRGEVIGKRVIVFDENHCTGTSVETVARCISEEVAPDQEVEITYNVNTGIGDDWIMDALGRRIAW